MVNISKLTKKRLGEILIAEGLITQEQVQEALKEQQKKGILLGEALIELGYVTEIDIASAFSTQFGLPYIDASHYTIVPEVMALFPVEYYTQHQLVPLDKIGNILIIAVGGTLSEKVFLEIEQKTSCEVFIFVSTTSQVKAAIANAAKAPETKK
jgi:type IV pilus assembly protein PilB